MGMHTQVEAGRDHISGHEGDESQYKPAGAPLLSRGGACVDGRAWVSGVLHSYTSKRAHDYERACCAQELETAGDRQVKPPEGNKSGDDGRASRDQTKTKLRKRLVRDVAQMPFQQ